MELGREIETLIEKELHYLNFKYPKYFFLLQNGIIIMLH